MAVTYELIAKQNKARAGIITTPHGNIETPVFMPVGTQSTVKAVTYDQVRACGTEISLANTYHLFLRPGADLIAKAGGLHKWTNFHKCELISVKSPMLELSLLIQSLVRSIL